MCFGIMNIDKIVYITEHKNRVFPWLIDSGKAFIKGDVFLDGIQQRSHGIL